jgi:uncharacterized protein (TIGR02611 family)
MTDGAELTEAQRPGPAARLGDWRARVRALPGGAVLWRVGVTFAGIVVVAVGIVLLPLPGPGWLIIFAGLGLLATEYPWAGRLLSRLRAIVARWTRWATRQSRWVQAALALASLLFLLAVAALSWYLARLV